MASIQKSVNVKAAAQSVWDAISDAGQLHTRLVPSIVTDTRMEDDGDVRIVTFVNGMTLKEYMISNDDELRRLVWSAESDQWRHHNASLQVFPKGDGACDVVWTADVLPHAAGDIISGFVDMGLAAMKAHMESL